MNKEMTKALKNLADQIAEYYGDTYDYKGYETKIFDVYQGELTIMLSVTYSTVDVGRMTDLLGDVSEYTVEICCYGEDGENVEFDYDTFDKLLAENEEYYHKHGNDD